MIRCSLEQGARLPKEPEMDTIKREKCVACSKDSPSVTEFELTGLLPFVQKWRFTEKNGVRRLDRTFKMKNFSEALKLANRVADEAETQGHHPKMVVEWGRVNISWWTHKIGGLHRNDFVMAAKTDDIASGLGYE